MLDLSNVMVAAEVLKLAAVLSGDAQYILRQNVERCENAPFVRVAGDLAITGDLSMDWDADPWRGSNVCGLVVEGDLAVEGSLTNLDYGSGPVLLVLGGVTADRIVQGGASWMIRDDVRVRRTFFGVYNDGYVWIGGNLEADAVIDYDHAFTVEGKVVGKQIDLEHGHAWLADGLVNEDGDVEWDEIVDRARKDGTLTRDKPAAIDIFAAAADPGTELLAAALAAGADLEARDAVGNTPLLIAIGDGRLENLKMLLDAGADITAANKNGHGAVHLLTYSARDELLDLVLSQDPPLDVPDREGRTPMVRALDYRNLACVRRLHARGVALPPPDRKKEGFPYSLQLAERGNVELLAFLIENGADLDWKSTDMLSDGYTLLHEASWKSSVRSVELLLGAGLSPDARDARGRTPLRLMLDYAPRIAGAGPGDSVAVARNLLDAGADPLAKANDGRDPLDSAMAAGSDLLRIVLDAAAKTGRLDPARRAAAEKRLAGSS
jgi:ankyrin repeat protein